MCDVLLIVCVFVIFTGPQERGCCVTSFRPSCASPEDILPYHTLIQDTGFVALIVAGWARGKPSLSPG